jgi:YVTN family beta-propeller protein
MTERDVRGPFPRARASRGTVLAVLSTVSALAVALLMLLPAPAVLGLGHDSPARFVSAAPTYSRTTVAASVSLGGPTSEHPAFTGMGNLTTTIDLLTNRDLPGSVQPPFQDQQSDLLFDPLNGDLYVRGDGGEDITVVNSTTNEAITSIGVPGGGWYANFAPTVVVDPSTGYLYSTDSFAGNVTVLNGATNLITGSIPAGFGPSTILYDAANGDLYVTNWDSNNVTVISAATNHTVANVAVGKNPNPILFDPASSEVFVGNVGSNNVSVIDTTSNSLVATIPVGTYPTEFALDTADDYIDVVNEESDNVTAINASNLSVAWNRGVGSFPSGVTFVPIGDQIYVANEASDNVTVLNATDGAGIANLTTGLGPYVSAYDATDQLLYILNSEQANVTILDPATERSVANVDTADNFDYFLTVDTSNGNVYVDNDGSYYGVGGGIQANLTVISGGNESTIASIPLNVYPEGMAYDSGNGDLVAVDDGGADSYFVDPSTDRIVGISPASEGVQSVAYDSETGDLWQLADAYQMITVLNASGELNATIFLSLASPTSIAYDSANGDLYVTDNFEGAIWVFNGSNQSVIAKIHVHPYADLSTILYDPHTTELYVSDETNDNLTVLNGSQQVTVASIPVGSGCDSLAFDSANDTIFASNSISNNLTVINDSTHLAVANVVLDYPALIVYDPSNDLLYSAGSDGGFINALNAANYTLVGSLRLQDDLDPLRLLYLPRTQDVYVSDLYLGTISVISNAVTYSVSFVESGLVSPTRWTVYLNGTANSSLGNTIGFVEGAGSYFYTVVSVPGYIANPAYGTAVVPGSTIDIDFIPISSPTYPVTFIEAGLVASTPWSVTFNGAENSSASDMIGFLETPGNWTYTVGAVAGYTANQTIGYVVVNDSPQFVQIGFTSKSGTPGTYPVTFTESDLPTGTPWSVTLSGSLASSTTSTIGFVEGNDSYAFSVTAITGYTDAPASGTILVDGGPAGQGIQFTAIAIASLAASLEISPSTVELGASALVVTTATGGTAPYSYAYAGLPGGCTSSDAEQISCTSTQTGTFNVTVTVTDSGAQTRTASATLTVTPVAVSPGPTTSSTSSSEWQWVALAVVIIVAGLLILLLATRRRRKPAVAPWSGPGAPPAP